MKKRTVLTIMTVCLAASLLLVGCSSKDEPAKTPDDSNAAQTPDTPEAPEATPETTPEVAPEAPSDDAKQDEVGKLIGLIGLEDADVIAALGEGTPGETDGTLNYREYAMPIYGLDTVTTVSYEEGKVSMIIAGAHENKFGDWSAALEAELGDADATTENSDEGIKTKEMAWTMDSGVIVSLKDAYDSLSLEIFPGA